MVSLTTRNTALGSSDWPTSMVAPFAQTGFVSRDLDEVRTHMSDAFCPHRLMLDGKCELLDFRHAEASLRRLSFHLMCYGGAGGRVVVDIPPFEDAFLLQFSLSGVAEVEHRGGTASLVPNAMLMLPLREGATVSFDSSYLHLTVKVPGSFLAELHAEGLGCEAGTPVFTSEPIPLTGVAASLAHLISTTCIDIQKGGDGFRHARVIDATERMFGQLLLAAIPHDQPAKRQVACGTVKPYYIRRVEDYLRANSDDPIAISDMLRVSGVSARSLHAGFRRYSNDTPLSYLKKLRLERARTALSHADEDRSVTEVAFEVGFTHLSKFARDYRERFGETPSETLRRARPR